MKNRTGSLKLIRWQLPAQPDRYMDNRWVNLLSDPDDYHVVLLASMGMSYHVIAQQTGLSHGQISYRLRRANQHRKPYDRISSFNFRNGISEASQAVIQLAAKRVGQIIEPSLRRNLAIDVGTVNDNGRQ